MLSSLFGGSCFLCRGAARDLLCDACRDELPRLAGPACPRCALGSPRGEPCGRCLAEPPPYDATVAALAYAFPADVLIHALKFRGELALAPLLGGFLLEKIHSNEADFVIPVPLSNERLRERGYNQAVEIARATGKPVELDLCIRQRHTPQQADLPWSERQRNVRGAFACTRRLDGQSVAVVDDVMTTGATLAEVATTLKAAGAARVVNWVVARTLPPHA
ncbi:MAG TPA: ComF family protein [Burkholderiales bacterium]